MIKLSAAVVVALAVLASACGGAQRPRTEAARTYKCQSYNTNERCVVQL
jgi:hypothetical protein